MSSSSNGLGMQGAQKVLGTGRVMKRDCTARLAAILTFCCVGFVLAGCGNNQSGAAPSTTGENAVNAAPLGRPEPEARPAVLSPSRSVEVTNEEDQRATRLGTTLESSIQPEPPSSEREDSVPFWTPFKIDTEKLPTAPDALVGESYRIVRVPGKRDSASVGEYGPYILTGLARFGTNRGTVYDSRTGKVYGTVDNVLKGGDAFLSPNGRAVCHNNMAEKEVTFFDTQSDRRTTVAFPKETLIDVLTIRDGIVVIKVNHVGQRSREENLGNELVAFDPVDGRELWRKVGKSTDFAHSEDQVACDPTGRYLGMIDYAGNLSVYDLQQEGRQVANWKGVASSAVKSLTFSPDARFFAVFIDRIYVPTVDATVSAVQIVDTKSGNDVGLIPIGATYQQLGPTLYNYDGRPIEWFPDGEHLLIAGYLVVSRPLGRVVLEVTDLLLDGGSSFSNDGCRIPMRNGLASLVGSNDSAGLGFLPLPMSSLAAIERHLSESDSGKAGVGQDSREAEVVLRPEDEVRIVVSIGDMRSGDAGEMKAVIEDVTAEIVATRELYVAEDADDSAVILDVQYEEGEGEKIYEKLSDALLSTQTGRITTGTAIGVTLRFLSPDSETVYWRESFVIDPKVVVGVKDFTKEAVREKAVAQFVRQLESVTLPFYLTSEARPAEPVKRSSARRRRKPKRATEPVRIDYLPYRVPLSDAAR